jgi:hypothetical protein
MSCCWDSSTHRQKLSSSVWLSFHEIAVSSFVWYISPEHIHKLAEILQPNKYGLDSVSRCKTRVYSLVCSNQFWARHPASNSMVMGGSFPGGKAAVV